MARAVGRRKGLGQVATLAQGDAVLETGATLGCALGSKEDKRKESANS